MVQQEERKVTNKWLAFAASIAPGLFLLGYNIGTGSVTTMAVSGAKYGMQLLWALLLSCLGTFFLIVVFGKYTIITKKTALYSFRESFGKGVSMFILFSLVASELISCAGVMGVMTQVVQEWSRPFTESNQGISPLFSALFFGALLFILIYQAKFSLFEKVLAIFVGLMAICFIITMGMTSPPSREYLEGLIPSLPSERNSFLIVAGMVGTTMGGVLYVVRSILVSEKEWKISDLKIERRDAAISAGLMFFLSVAIMACAAGTLKPRGLQVDNAIEMVLMMEPIAGKFATSLFVLGIVCAGLSSLFPILLLAPWLIADFQGKKRNLKSTSSRTLVLVGLFASLFVPLFGGRPIGVMITSQALTIIVTPLILVLMIILMNRRSEIGDYKFKTWENVCMLLIITFTFAMAVIGILGLISEYL